MKLFDNKDKELDFYTEMTKYAGYLWKSYTARHLAIYELYKKTMDIPGSIAEFGLYHGSTFFFLARLIEIFHSSEHEVHHSSSRNLFGFDGFEGFYEIGLEDETSRNWTQMKRGGLKGDRDSFYRVLNEIKSGSAIANRIHVIEGDVCQTFGNFLSEFKGVKLSFCLMDLDVFKPTEIVLESLYDIMISGGIITFDEYGFRECPGETQAVDCFIKRYGLTLKSFPWTFAPSAYCVV